MPSPARPGKKILGLLRSNEQINANVPETPTHEQIARHIDVTVAERNYFAARRILEAKALDEAIKKHLPQIEFPQTAQRLVENLQCLRDLLNELEDMVVGSEDADMTESDSGSAVWNVDTDTTTVQSSQDE
ncbi:hypothetical protein B0H13DRAFT_2377468 [Mycena leptocephala]|nr:hypothetical protein B0H13DRAFT_2377468 [Mycena leptocephala]